MLALILVSVRAWSKSEQWRKNGGEFIPNPATWLNGRRWEDELPHSPPEDHGQPSKSREDLDRQMAEFRAAEAARRRPPPASDNGPLFGGPMP